MHLTIQLLPHPNLALTCLCAGKQIHWVSKDAIGVCPTCLASLTSCWAQTLYLGAACGWKTSPPALPCRLSGALAAASAKMATHLPPQRCRRAPPGAAALAGPARNGRAGAASGPLAVLLWHRAEQPPAEPPAGTGCAVPVLGHLGAVQRITQPLGRPRCARLHALLCQPEQPVPAAGLDRLSCVCCRMAEGCAQRGRDGRGCSAEAAGHSQTPAPIRRCHPPSLCARTAASMLSRAATSGQWAAAGTSSACEPLAMPTCIQHRSLVCLAAELSLRGCLALPAIAQTSAPIPFCTGPLA